ncbi:hypothetical protein PPH41_38030, partial [Burkholderia gladioli]|nr:hypothetical protein [Burkholderia gladioli]
WRSWAAGRDRQEAWAWIESGRTGQDETMHGGGAMRLADCPRTPAGARIGSESLVRNAKLGRMSGPRAGIAANRGG